VKAGVVVLTVASSSSWKPPAPFKRKRTKAHLDRLFSEMRRLNVPQVLTKGRYRDSGDIKTLDDGNNAMPSG